MLIQERYEDISRRVAHHQSQRALLGQNIEKWEYKVLENNNKAEVLKGQIVIQQESISKFKEMIDLLSKEQIFKIQALVTDALQAIFYDKSYSLDIVFGERGTERTVEFVLVERKIFREEEVELRTSFEDGIGGGVMVVVGFFLQVFFIIYFGLARVIFCDESFSQLSDTYLPNLLEFVKTLGKERDFRIILISHDPRITENASRVYLVSEGGVKEVGGVKNARESS